KGSLLVFLPRSVTGLERIGSRLRSNRSARHRLDTPGWGTSVVPAAAWVASCWRRYRLSPDLPVVAKRIVDPSQAPAECVANLHNLGCAGRHRVLAEGVRVLDDQQHPHRSAAQRLGTEVQLL